MKWIMQREGENSRHSYASYTGSDILFISTYQTTVNDQCDKQGHDSLDFTATYKGRKKY